MRHMVICMKCGYVDYSEDDIRKIDQCRKCNGTLYHTAVNANLFQAKSIPAREEFEDDLRRRIVFDPDNEEFDMRFYEMWKNERARIKESNERIRQEALKRQAEERERQANRCPKCGSMSGFTPVRKNWSLISGRRTNQIDMVCNHCGYIKK